MSWSWFYGHDLFVQWLVAAASVLAVLLAGRLSGRVVIIVLSRLARTTDTTIDDLLLERVAGPVRVACTIGLAALILPWLALDDQIDGFATDVLRTAAVVVIFWFLVRLVDVGREGIERRPWAQTNPSSRSLVSIGARSVKVLLIVLSLLTVLATQGIPIASLVAGLGIGGLAVALAAQKTIENLFGTYSIGLDQPFREGDFVRIGDRVGTIEAIGLRSTRLRTLDRTTVLIPNGQLADTPAESFTARDRIRLSCTIGMVYGTTVGQMRRILADLEALLRAHPLIWPDAVVVRFKELAAYSLDVEVMAWFQTSDWSEFQKIREEILLGFMEVVEANGSSFAFPTRTLHHVRETSRNAKEQPADN